MKEKQTLKSGNYYRKLTQGSGSNTNMWWYSEIWVIGNDNQFYCYQYSRFATNRFGNSVCCVNGFIRVPNWNCTNCIRDGDYLYTVDQVDSESPKVFSIGQVAYSWESQSIGINFYKMGKTYRAYNALELIERRCICLFGTY